jgi:hypothetical protein
MMLWGLATGLVAALALWALSPAQWPMMPSRSAELHASMTVLRQGGPLLLGRHGLSGSFYPIGSDEAGIYIYLPLLSRLLGVSDPVSLLRYCYVILYGLTAASYPFVFYRLTRSMLAGLAAPIMLVAYVLSMGFSDTYWILAWGALTLLPPIYLLARDWPRFGWLALGSIAFAAGWLSSIRANAGLPIMIAAVMVLLMRRLPVSRLLAALALLLVAYASIATFAIGAVVAHSDRRLTVAAKRAEPVPHVWHTLYIGLGYLPNDYGIRYKDEVAVARVQREAPGTPYLSSRYVSVIRKAYFDVVRADPVEVLWQYTAKALVTAADAFPYILLALLTIPAMLLLGCDRLARRRWTLLTIAVVIAVSTPTVLAIPAPSYELGLDGTLSVLAILGVCWALAQLGAVVVEQDHLRSAAARLLAAWSASSTTRRPIRRAAGISCCAVAIFLALGVGGHFIRQSADRWQGAPSGSLMERLWI